MIMLDDAVRANAKEDEVRVLDLSQLFEESLLAGAATGTGSEAAADPAGAGEAQPPSMP